MNLLSTLYGAVARRRRRWYAERPAARRRLARPVVSVGALTVGGSGKTPVAACVAELLLRVGERPAVLSRGYGRAARPPGVVVVRDPHGVRAGLAEAGDEPLMLAERLAGACVLVCADRHRAGRLAEERFGVTVHVLDDGFQHLSLDRDVDIVVIGAEDASERRTLPGGRLREQPDAAALADALVVEAPTREQAASVAGRFGDAPAFRLVRRLGTPIPEAAATSAAASSAAASSAAASSAAATSAAATSAAASSAAASSTDTGGVPRGARVLAVAGIARPAAFADDVRAAGYELAGLLAFADHHRFSRADAARVMARARDVGADFVLTTEKDAVRLRPLAPVGVPWARVPLRVEIDPADRFEDWLVDRLRAARRSPAGAP